MARLKHMTPQQLAQLSPSVELLRGRLTRQKVSQKAFAKATGLTPEYVSRIFNGKVKFPKVRETLEKFAEVCSIEATEFVEYKQLLSALPPSTRMLWGQLHLLGLSRSEFADRVDLSRTYLYEILRGDVPFPKNPDVIEKIAKAADILPTIFEEYLAPVHDRLQRDPQLIEHIFLNMLVDRMLFERGFSKVPSRLQEIPKEMMKIFPPLEQYEPPLLKVLAYMGREQLSVPTLAQKADVPQRDLRLLLMGQMKIAEFPEVMKRLLAILPPNDGTTVELKDRTPREGLRKQAHS